MDVPPDLDKGRFEARYLAFLETVKQLRPRLHRYCARMTGSAIDGEDVVQESLFEAYRKLDQFDGSRPLQPWLYRIAHNRCIDFLRRRAVRHRAETFVATEVAETVPSAQTAGVILDHAVEHLVITLPPKERACVLLKDVLDYSLEEIAELVDSTVGGVKAALSRSRAKLRSAPMPARTRLVDTETNQLLQQYVERFNRQDWAGLRELISADARVRVADRYAGSFSDAPYFGTYERWPVPLKTAVGNVDGAPVIVILRREGELWKPRGAVRLRVVDQRITHIFDYFPCPWLLESAELTISPQASN
jgi:RNA polymerase sigma-70 factor (ECF subfamily)